MSHGCEKPVKKGEKKKTGEEDAELIVDPYCDVGVNVYYGCRFMYC